MNRSFIMLLVLVLFLGAGFGGSFIGGVIYGQTLEDETSELSPRLGAAGQFPGGDAGAAAGQRGLGRQGQGGGFAGGQAAGEQQQALQPAGPGNASGRQGRGGQAGAATEQLGGGEGNQTEGQPAQVQPVSEPEGRQRDGTGQSVDSQAANEAAAPESAAAGNPATQTTPSMEDEASAGGSSEASGRSSLVGTVSSLEGDTLTVISARGETAAMLSDSTSVFQIAESSRDSLTSETLVRVIGSRSQEGGLAAQSVIIMPAGTEDLFGAAGGPGGRRRGVGP
ncbi:MAG: hypothetical protein OXE17_04575 [Chloroflexi bacterium]|nr:hypothetical protein [Chloroflexota bacterium]